jgi:hypothetical protein
VDRVSLVGELRNIFADVAVIAGTAVGMLLGTNDGASLGIIEPTGDGIDVDGDDVATEETNAGDGTEEDGDAVVTAETNAGPVDGAADEDADSLSQIKGHSISPVTSSGIEN